ncbi:MAG: sulfate adenylyltransferase subunit 1 [Oligoflexus sp.]
MKTLSTPSSSLLRLATAGSVDDGKSTLIGRLLYEAKALFDDQISAIEKQRKEDGILDLSLVTDGLKSEREQGITIDVAYKYFSSAKRKYILADSPGHVQYTRNMVTAASLADAALILVDAQHGIVEQTRRHAFLIHLLGVRHVVLAINKIDLINYDQQKIAAIERDFRNLSWNQEHASLHVIPLSALCGDNVSETSARTPWYQGPSLIDLLDQLPSRIQESEDEGFHLPIQYILRSGTDVKRLATGTIQQGQIKIGDTVQVLPSLQKSRIAAIYVAGKSVQEAQQGQAVAIGLADELDLERGFQIVDKTSHWQKKQNVTAELVWFDDEPLQKDRLYILRSGVQTSRAKIERIDYRFDLQNLGQISAQSLETNEIARVHLDLSRPTYLKSFQDHAYAGSFILIDPQTHRTVAAGMVTSLENDKNLTKSRQRLLFVDKFAPRDEYSLGKLVQISDEFISLNQLTGSKRVIETLYELGWEIHLERGTHSHALRQELEAQGYGTYEDGAGI